MKSSFFRVLISGLLLSIFAAAFMTNRSISAQDATTTPTTPQVMPSQVVQMEGTRSSDGTGFVRIVHASPDVAAINVALSGQLVASALEFGANSDFIELPANTYTVDVTTSAGSGILSKPLVLAPGTSATLVLTGMSTGTSGTALDLGMFLTEREPTRGKARLDVINAVPDVPAMDLITTEPLLTSIAFGKVSDAVLNLAPGSYDFKLVSSDAKAQVLDMTGTQLQADTIYTIVVLGQQNNGTVKPLILTTTPVAPPPTPTVGATLAPGITVTATFTVIPTVTGTVMPTTEATVETTSEATAETTALPTMETTSEATSAVTATPTTEPTLEMTAEVTASP